uniref:Uncharacterized protein n=1 Tax=Anguilla anguilla TaxID=7936 RepID=A0A0E9X1K9_ANGAN
MLGEGFRISKCSHWPAVQYWKIKTVPEYFEVDGSVFFSFVMYGSWTYIVTIRLQ